ncbi:MAG: acyl-CoA reductase-like NAD-dependent aldehyde dehydrogenase [Kiritimatiellia bacterium]|jgi:acyl-CoA reductase-like NAD-dependent aldehyde dehydrogenase
MKNASTNGSASGTSKRSAKKSPARKTATVKKPTAPKAVTPSAGSERIHVQKTYKIYIGGQFPRTESGRYYKVHAPDGSFLADICLSSRKDFRNSVVAARSAFAGWSSRAAFNRGQILYRISEILEGRRAQFIDELIQQGRTKVQATAEVNLAIERLVHYAGWADKVQQIFSSVNPVASSHFNFSMLEPTGVVAILAPEESSLVGLISVMAPIITGGNTCVILASESKPLCAITLAEVLNASDVPGGVVNILTGKRKELSGQFASHMDVNAVVYTGADPEESKDIQLKAVDNIKRVINHADRNWMDAESQSPYYILDALETKTTWHPVGN